MANWEGVKVIYIDILSRNSLSVAEEQHEVITNTSQIQVGHDDERNNTAFALKKLCYTQWWIGAEIFKHLVINIHVQYVRKPTHLSLMQ